MATKSLHLVCSSGGVKCYSYVGAVKCLEEHGYEIKSVAASSMGSIIGIMVCAGLKASEIEKKILDFKLTDYIKKKYWIKWAGLLKFPFAIYHTPNFKKIICDIIGHDLNLGELKIPYATLALDLRQRELLIYSSSTHPHIACSEILKIATAVPPIYPPYLMDKRLLVDAGVATESPAWISANLSEGEPVIVLKTSKPADEKYWNSFNAFINNMVTSAAASNDNFSLNQIDNAIRVEINCGDQLAEDFKITSRKIEKLILQGYEAMQRTMHEVNNDFRNHLKIENFASTYNPIDDAEQAAFNSTHFARKFIRQTAIKRDLIFVSYSHKDKMWFDKIKTFLGPMKEFNQIKVWDDTEILPGQKWRDAIQDALTSAKVALCIVTQNFLNSEFITENELSYFIKMTEKENVPIFWIAASTSIFDMTPFKDIQCAHDPALPLDMQSDAEQNVTFTDICRKLAATMTSK